MKIEVCDRCYNVNHKLASAKRTVSIVFGHRKVRGFLCQPHSDEYKTLHPEKVTAENVGVRMNELDNFLLGLDVLLKRPAVVVTGPFPVVPAKSQEPAKP